MKTFSKVLKLTPKERAREYRLKKVYGITTKQYDQILKSQGGACWICQKLPKEGKNLCVDHNHKTGEVRGLLCFMCNRRLVGRHTDPDLFAMAAKYLSQGTGLFVPPKIKKKKRKK